MTENKYREMAKEILRVGEFKKPVSVKELEALLEKESTSPIQIMPDGSIADSDTVNETVKRVATALESVARESMHNHPLANLVVNEEIEKQLSEKDAEIFSLRQQIATINKGGKGKTECGIHTYKKPTDVVALEARIKELEGDKKGLVMANALLRQRHDLPVDRIPAYKEFQDKITSLESEIAELRKQMFDMKLLPNQGHCCDGFCLGTCLEGTRLSQKLEKAVKAIKAVSHYDNGCGCCATKSVSDNELVKEFLKQIGESDESR